MKTRLLHLWEVLTSSYWFVPGLMLVGAMGLAWATLSLDEKLASPLDRLGWFYGGGKDGARALLSTIAGGVITVAGVVFSITIATLTQASSQFGPRLLRNFMRDSGNQVVLGTFVGTFIYCVLILRSIRGTDDGIDVPQASVSVALVLSLASIAVLIYFIHHVSLSLQAPIVVAAVFDDLKQAISAEYPDALGNAIDPHAEGGDDLLPRDFDDSAVAVPCPEDGYLQAVDQSTLIETAAKHDLIVRLNYRPGHYLLCGAPLLHVWPGPRVDDALIEKFSGMFIIGRQRTAEQDLEFALHQLVEIGVRSLSSGVNDPFTAIQCIDRLASALGVLATRAPQRPGRMDKHGQLRVLTPVPTFRGFVDAAFNQIRQNARGNVAVTIRLLEVISELAPLLRSDAQRPPLLRQLEMISGQWEEESSQAGDLRDIRDRYHKARQALAPDAAGARAPAMREQHA